MGMVLTRLNLKKEDREKTPTVVVPVPQWGEDAEVMLTRMTVKGYVRRSNLQTRITKMDGLDDNARSALFICAQLISVMIHPETGDFLLPEDQLEEFTMQVNEQSLEALMLADAELNPRKELITLAEKKSES